MYGDIVVFEVSQPSPTLASRSQELETRRAQISATNTRVRQSLNEDKARRVWKLNTHLLLVIPNSSKTNKACDMSSIRIAIWFTCEEDALRTCKMIAGRIQQTQLLSQTIQHDDIAVLHEPACTKLDH